MKAGMLRHFVRIERRPDAPERDEHNVEQNVWIKFADILASITPRVAREALDAERIVSTTEYIVTARWLAGVTEQMRVNVLSGPYEGKVFSVQGVLPDNKAREIRLLCTDTL